MIFKKPSIRISLALALLTMNLLLVANMLGLVPSRTKTEMELRKRTSETLALQFVTLAEKGDFQAMQNTLRAVVERNGDILSAAIRTEDDRLIALAGEHLAHWKTLSDGKSTSTQIDVPIFRNGQKWASAEIRYKALWNNNLKGWVADPFIRLLFFVTLCGFVCFFLVLRRALRELDPTAVIPARVQNAFDVLQEGVLILDTKEHVVMSNKAFSALFKKDPKKMVGLKGSELGWLDYRGPEKIKNLPWFKVLTDGKDQKNISMDILDRKGNRIKLVANASSISDNTGRSLGCMVTFDDVTELEEKNFELSRIVERLRETNTEVESKSRELEFHANHDPLTLGLNRRALNRQFKDLFSEARAEGKRLCCLMADIDFFKEVNDRHGHAAGDRVIRTVADRLRLCTRDHDLIGRYGGEEFCVALPGISMDIAVEVAERIRQKIEKEPCDGIRISVSLGVSSLEFDAGNVQELIDQADKALYVAKKSGRNRVVCWGDEGAWKMSESASGVAAGETKAAAELSNEALEVAKLQCRIMELEGLLEKRSIESKHAQMFDVGTGLPTFSLFKNRAIHEIARARRTDNLLAVVSISIETIKRVRETLGYEASRQLVKAFGERLNDVLRNNIDMIAMANSDDSESTVSIINPTEFGILLTDFKAVDHVTWVVKRMLDALAKPFLNDIHISAYFGISLFPRDGETLEVLYSSAANACTYAQKNKKKKQYYFSSNALNEMAARQLQIENLLHRAIGNDELLIHYQPKIEAATGRIAGFEALVRWNSPQLGMVSPGEFTPIAEQTRQIDQIGDWVLRAACGQLRSWLDMGIDAGPVAINLSGLQLRQRNLAGRIQDVLNEFELPTSLLEIELTETSLINIEEHSISVLKQIEEMGVRVSIDDFGVGYSSLSYLRNIPISCVKIDRSFVFDIGRNDQAEKLIASIVSMAHGIGLVVVAEGVEEKHQADYLTALGCEYLQGFYFSRPVPEDKVPEMLVALVEEQRLDISGEKKYCA